MPIVTPTKLVDRLRDFKNRIDPRAKLQSASKRWQETYEQLAVGSPYQVHEFYKYIKVYKPCPSNDLLFMNMTVQLARAALFPTNSMFKEMLKFEKHMDDLIRSEGHQSNIFGSQGMAILASHNPKFLDRYIGYKRRVIRKCHKRNMKKAAKDAKVLDAVKEARWKLKDLEIQIQRKGNLKVGSESKFWDFDTSAPNAQITNKGDSTPKVLSGPPKVSTIVCPSNPHAQQVSVADSSLSDLPKVSTMIISSKIKSEASDSPTATRSIKEDVELKLNDVVEQLIQVNSNHVDDDDEVSEVSESDDEVSDDYEISDDEEDIGKVMVNDEVSDDEEVSDKVNVNVEEVVSEDEDVEKIDHTDVDALEYEML